MNYQYVNHLKKLSDDHVLGANERQSLLFTLGYDYMIGANVPKSTEKAKFYLHEGATLGCAYCSYVLSLLYKNGFGCDSDKEISDKYRELSFRQGLTKDDPVEVCYLQFTKQTEKWQAHYYLFGGEYVEMSPIFA